MKRKIKSYVLNMHVVGAFSVLVICVSLISCNYWFGKDDDYDVEMGNVYAGYADPESGSELTPLPTERFELFAELPEKERIEKNEIGSRLFKTRGQLLDP